MINEERNEFYVEQVVPLSTEQALVTGHVAAGRFRTGEWVSFRSSPGLPLMVSISRLGSAESPVKVIREGQRMSIVVDVEPENIGAGVVLLAAGDDDSTMTTKFLEDIDLRSLSEAELLQRKRLKAIDEQVGEGDYRGAHQMLFKCLEECGDSAGVFRLLARVHLESKDELHDIKEAQDYIQRAYDADGAHDAAVWETLAHVLGASGEIEPGLRFLERLYAKSLDAEAVEYYEEQIHHFRKKYGVPDLWEIINELGELVFETNDFSQIRRAAARDQFPENSTCRKNRCGELVDVRAVLSGKDSGNNKRPANQENPWLINTAIGAVAGLAVGIVLGELSGFSMAAVALACGILGGGAGAVLLKRSQKTAGQSSA